MPKPFDRRARSAPSHYPKFIFHAIRSLQLIASIVVGCIMIYFLWHLTHEHYSPPWTFILLTAASLFSILSLTFTIIMHCFFGLNPRMNASINCVLLGLWALSWSLLTWWTSRTMTHLCDYDTWKEELGVMVCRIYKTLFAFTVVGFVSTIAAFALDIYVRRRQTRRGVYRLHDMDTKNTSEATRGPFTDDHHVDEPRQSEAWEQPRHSIGPYMESTDPNMQAQGYAMPENQFDYDTGYHERQSQEGVFSRR